MLICVDIAGKIHINVSTDAYQHIGPYMNSGRTPPPSQAANRQASQMAPESPRWLQMANLYNHIIIIVLEQKYKYVYIYIYMCVLLAQQMLSLIQ